MQVDLYTNGIIQAQGLSTKTGGLSSMTGYQEESGAEDEIARQAEANRQTGRQEADQAAVDAENARIKRESLLTYLKVYQETYGSPEEKELQEQAAEAAKSKNGDEDEEERVRRQSKHAIVYEDPDDPGKVNVAAQVQDAQGNPVITRTHSIDTGGGDNKDEDSKSGQSVGHKGDSGGTEKDSGESKWTSLFG